MNTKKPYRILWVSRHPTTPRQVDGLRELFGEVKVDMDPRPFDSAEDIVKRFRDGGYDDMVVVAPLSVIAQLINLGVKPLYSEMEPCTPEEAEVTMKRRNRTDYYRFKRFRRVKMVRLEFEEP